MKCPVVKSFRTELTRNLLNNNNNRASPYSSTVNNNNIYQYNSSDFPQMPTRWLPSNSSMISKLDELITGMSKVNEILGKMSETNKRFEQFITNKNEHDMKVISEIDHLKSNDRKLEKELVLVNAKIISHDNLIKQQDEMLKKLLLPILDGLLKLNNAMNIDNNGRVLDADCRSKFERYRAQVNNCREGRIFV
ncbi:unnamed protein product [Didymodactylos carnosus]|uniref:Uncharacterized protein n=1 Tax=Didymodactylos carnosus TaxID=1234261 RepID=A0A8S2YA79_9BILA|nr:unnamed protein product [Didymodactylos carnosus]